MGKGLNPLALVWSRFWISIRKKIVNDPEGERPGSARWCSTSQQTRAVCLPNRFFGCNSRRRHEFWRGRARKIDAEPIVGADMNDAAVGDGIAISAGVANGNGIVEELAGRQGR